MEYKLKIDEKIHTAEVSVIDDNHFKVVFNGREYETRYERIGGCRIYLNINGKGINAYIDRASDGKAVLIGGTSYAVEDAERIVKKSSKGRKHSGIPQQVTPPMPAVIVRIMVKEGDTVEKGQALVVVSAMKLETTLTAPYSGAVTAVNAAEGDKVMPGQVLVDIKKDDQGGSVDE